MIFTAAAGLANVTPRRREDECATIRAGPDAPRRDGHIAHKSGTPARVEKIVLGRVANCYLATRTAHGQTIRPKVAVDYYLRTSSTGWFPAGRGDGRDCGFSLLLSN